MLPFILLILVALIAVFFLRGKLGVAADGGVTTIDETKMSASKLSLKPAERKGGGSTSRSPVSSMQSGVKPVEKSATLVPSVVLKESTASVGAPLLAQTESFASTKTAIRKVGPSDSVARHIIGNLEAKTPNPEITGQQPPLHQTFGSEPAGNLASTDDKSASVVAQADKKVKKLKSKKSKHKKSSRSPDDGKERKKKSLRLETPPKA